MGFETVNTVPRMPRVVTGNPDGVSVGIYQRKSDSARLTIFIGRNVLAQMGLKLGDRVVVQEGAGPDHGMFRVVPAGPTGGLTLTGRDGSKGGSARNIAMPSVSVDTKRTKTLRGALPINAEAATFQRFGSSLTLVVPWCRAPEDDSSPWTESHGDRLV